MGRLKFWPQTLVNMKSAGEGWYILWSVSKFADQQTSTDDACLYAIPLGRNQWECIVTVGTCSLFYKEVQCDSTHSSRLPSLIPDTLMAAPSSSSTSNVDISKMYVDPKSHFDKTLIGLQSYSTCAPRFLLNSWLMSATLSIALRSPGQLGTLRRP
jgi:hypothetical protein